MQTLPSFEKIYYNDYIEEKHILNFYVDLPSPNSLTPLVGLFQSLPCPAATDARPTQPQANGRDSLKVSVPAKPVV